MSSLTITDLFNPDPSGVDPQNPSAPPPAGSWRAKLTDLGVIVGLATTDWNPGGITRSLMSILSLALNAADQILSVDLQGGLLDWAASVTDDPASLGTAARPGWLDALCDGNYNVQRIGATAARGIEQITSAASVTYGPFAPGTYHVSNGATGATFSNVDTISIAPGVSSANMVADVAGAAGSSAPNTINSTVTALLGVLVTNPASFIGSNPESNASLVARTRAKFGSLSPNGAPDAYRYFAVTAFSLLAAMTPPVNMSQPITRVLVQSVTLSGASKVTCANAAGAPSGAANVLITGATNATPIVITVSSTAGMIVGDWLRIDGVLGNTAANGFHRIGPASFTGTTFSLVQADGSTAVMGNGSYTGGGVLEEGDLGLVDYIIHANSVPVGITELTVAASNLPITVAITIYVPAASAAAVPALVQSAIAQYFASAPIGGFVTGVPTPNTIPLSGLLSYIAQSLRDNKITVIDQSGTLNGSAADVAVAASQVAVVSGTPTITVIGS